MNDPQNKIPIAKLIAELCPGGVEFKTLGEIGSFTRGNGLQKKDFTDSGVPCIHYGQIYTYYGNFTDKTKSFVSADCAKKLRKAKKGDLIITTTSENLEDVCKCLVWLGEEEVCVGGETSIYSHDQNPKYIAYCLQTTNFFDFKKKNFIGTKVVRVHQDKLKEYKIPVPPMEVQREIVRILDKFTELISLLERERILRKKQYAYYREKLLTFGADVPRIRLGEIGKICMCKRIMKNETNSTGGIPFYKIGTFGKEPDAYISEELYEKYRNKFSYPKKGDILISASGTIGRTVVFDGKPSYFQDSNIVWIDNDEKLVTNKFLRHVYQITKWKTEGGTIKRLYNEILASAEIPLPPLSEQKRIANMLDRFDALCNDLSSGIPAEIAARKKQYEYYRDRLLTFREKIS